MTMTGKVANTQRVISVAEGVIAYLCGRGTLHVVVFALVAVTVKVAAPLPVVPHHHRFLCAIVTHHPVAAAFSVTLNGFLMSLAMQAKAQSALPKLFVTTSTR